MGRLGLRTGIAVLHGRLAQRLRLVGRPSQPRITLAPLTLAASSLQENAVAGTVIGGILGATSGSTVTLVATAGGRFALGGGALVAGATTTDYEAAASHEVTLRETLAGATNSPRDTVLTIAVANVFEQPDLAALSLAGAGALRVGTTASGAIAGATAGSAIAATGLPAGFTVNGPARTWAYDGTGQAGAANALLTETLGDSANSPRASAVAITIAAAPPPRFFGTTATTWGSTAPQFGIAA